MFERRIATICIAGLLATVSGVRAGSADAPPTASRHRQVLHDAATERLLPDPPGGAPETVVVEGPYVSVQVNVVGAAQNSAGDAANEPSIAVSPIDPDVIVIGWRQFNFSVSNHREAGWAYSHSGGLAWNFVGVLDPGLLRTDPVVDVDADGNFYYQSLSQLTTLNHVFRSTNDGVSWQLGVGAFGGDKNWMAVDRTGGIGNGHVYVTWNPVNGCCGTASFSRSIDGGQSFELPIDVVLSPKRGTMTVGPDGTVYIVGVDATPAGSSDEVVISYSTTARDPAAVPTFIDGRVTGLGSLRVGGEPNPGGLAGQAVVATDHSGGAHHGNVYVLASVGDWPFLDATNPLDVRFVRSTDGGATWSAPVRVNDDPPGQGVWHWFATFDVAPNGRIDAVWNDTRYTGFPHLSQLYYSYSTDGGETWSPNVPASPVWNSHVGWPQQDKIGDYYDMFSDDFGAGVAYSATFNNEQDVYFVRVFPDCNENGTSDVGDARNGPGLDCNVNDIPDECETDCNGNGVPDDCDVESQTSDDCNANLVPDECETDCNDNDVPDDCDIAGATSDDCNANAVPDECEADCNDNDVADECDIASGTSFDCNADGVPNECDPDCNETGVSDACDIEGGTSTDCDGNGVPDECDPDCNGDAVPDGCEDDCNANGLADVCELLWGIAPDCNANASPDDCDVTGFELHTISNTVSNVQAAVAVDVTGNGQLDVVSAAGDDRISWHENLDGNGTFGPPQMFSNFREFPSDIAVCDVNGDLLDDLVVVFLGDDRVGWFGNLGGSYSTVPLPVWPNLLSPTSVGCGNIDGDDDPDVVAAGGAEDLVSWYDNKDGQFPYQPNDDGFVTNQTDFPRSIFIVDVDGDGDMDVLSASQNDDEIAWYENCETPGFFQPQSLIATDALGARAVFGADLDGDDDVDVLSASYDDDRVAWYENLDGNGSFGPAQTLSSTADGAQDVVAADLDGDGDVDVLSASRWDDTIAWYENLDGNGGFSPKRIVSDTAPGVKDIRVADIDQDGLPDILAGFAHSSTVAWFENLHDDCDGDLSPDQCTPDCNANSRADVCDLVSGSSIDCNGNGVPDECETACPGCDDDGDGCVNDLDGDPSDGVQCGDADGDGCDDCVSGLFDPANDGTDADADGICDMTDCDAAASGVWLPPQPVDTLRLHDALSSTTLSWSAPSDPGADAVSFDLLRSPDARDFLGPASCLATGATDSWLVDTDTPAPGGAFYYLVRVKNDCPGQPGATGTNSSGAPRPLTTCP